LIEKGKGKGLGT